MPVEVKVPALGESILEATVGEWLKAEGDAIRVGDPLVELETEKVAVEVAAEETGVLERIMHREGDTVHVGEVLVELCQKRHDRRALHDAPAADRHRLRFDLDAVKVEADFRFRFKMKTFFLPTRLLARVSPSVGSRLRPGDPPRSTEISRFICGRGIPAQRSTVSSSRTRSGRIVT